MHRSNDSIIQVGVSIPCHKFELGLTGLFMDFACKTFEMWISIDEMIVLSEDIWNSYGNERDNRRSHVIVLRIKASVSQCPQSGKQGVDNDDCKAVLFYLH